MHHSVAQWTRPEYLTEITNSKFVDLAAANLFSEDHDELDEPSIQTKESTPWQRWIRRVTHHANSLVSYITSSSPSAGLQQDLFGFHKLIVVGTRRGMVAAIDTMTGEIAWRRFNGEAEYQRVSLVRSSNVKYPPILTVVAVLQDEVHIVAFYYRMAIGRP